jgi:hypothetical protein
MCVMTFSDPSLPPVSAQDAAPLLVTVAGSVLLPGDTGYDDERVVWNLNHELVKQRRKGGMSECSVEDILRDFEMLDAR